MAATKLASGLMMVVLLWGAMSQVADGSSSVSAYDQCPPLMGMASWCQPMVRCSVFWTELVKSSNPICYGRSHSEGSTIRSACCPMVVGGHNAMGLIRETQAEDEMALVPPGELKTLIDSRRELSRLAALEINLPEYMPFLSGSSSVTPTALMGQLGLMVTRTTQKLQKMLQLSKEGGGIGTQMMLVEGTSLSDACIAAPVCQQYPKYRTIDGSCNNPKMPLLGRANTEVGRILTPQYEDGVYQMKKRGYPIARLVRRTLAPDNQDVMDFKITALVMQFGQFVAHDLSFIQSFRLANTSSITCCTDDGQHQDEKSRHPHCIALDIPIDDPFYGQHNVRCINMVRSQVAPRSTCNFGYAHQLNSMTQWLDGSHIYGFSQSKSDELRERRGGRLRMFHLNHRELLPLDEEDSDCIGFDKGLRCFLAGDSRPNMQITLTALHTIFARQHNYLAQILSRLNPRWTDEQLFQTARQIVIAQLQHITYNEYLPVILGKATMSKYGLLPQTSGYFSQYRDDVTSVTLDAFTGAAYRYGHSLVTHAMDLVAEDGSCYYRMNLKDWFLNPHPLRQEGVLDGVLRGMVYHNSMMVDGLFSTDLTNFLFRSREDPFGEDLISFNIQRGRDQGLPGYTAYREMSGLPKVRSFDDMHDVFPRKVIDAMRAIYRSPDDVDLYVGGINEMLKPEGSLVGVTFNNIIAHQFARLKQADSFWYELGGRPSSFTPGQLEEIRKTSMASLFCLNGDDIQHMPTLTFLSVSAINRIVPCSQIPSLSLSPWKE